MSQQFATTMLPQQSDILGTVPTHLWSKNFILHFVYDNGRQNRDIMGSRLYCVGFLMSNVEEDPDWSHEWIVDKIMN